MITNSNQNQQYPYNPSAMHIRIAEMEAQAEENKRRMHDCDSLARIPKMHREPAKRAYVPSLHDLAAGNSEAAEMLRVILRRAQAMDLVP